MQVGLPNAVPPQAFSPSFHSSAVVLKLLATKSCSFHEITASFLTENVLRGIHFIPEGSIWKTCDFV